MSAWAGIGGRRILEETEIDRLLSRCPVIMQIKLNEFGMNGWTLVSLSLDNMTDPRLIFKKQPPRRSSNDRVQTCASGW
jgi:hypothetical protein